MQVVISARHCEISDHLKQRGYELAKKAAQFHDRLSRMDITFNLENGHRYLATVICHIDGRDHIIVEAEGEHWGQTLHDLRYRTRRQLKKARAQEVEHEAPPLAERISPQGPDTEFA